MLVALFAIAIQANICLCGYWEDRQSLIDQDASYGIGSSILLTTNEKIVNRILTDIKLKEFEKGFDNVSNFLPARHFFDVKSKIENSEVYKFIQGLPKGANLHCHDTALLSGEGLFKFTYKENLYACIEDGTLSLKFFDSSNVDSTCEWILLQRLRRVNASIDNFIRSKLTLIVDNPEVTYENDQQVWDIFQKLFLTVSPLITYRPVFEEYFYNALEELYADNVIYLEFRGLLPEVYELNGTVYKEVEVAQLYINVLKRFKEDHPDFIGARFIYAPMRTADNITAWQYIDTLKTLIEKYPDFIAGFDLVGEEGNGHPIRDFVPQILSLEGSVKFFFHAGETNWLGTSVDESLFDAILLNTSRIGHGLALVKHPQLLRLVKERNIAIEVNSISNQVLRYVSDLRNHPAAILISQNYPVVIANDDPSFWGAKALSYDWYMAFMALSSKKSDLKLLKQLAINSLTYSSFNSEEEKKSAFTLWETKWEQYMSLIVEEYYEENENVQVKILK